MRNCAWPPQVPNYTHLQRQQHHLNCIRCSWDRLLMAVLRRIQRGKCFFMHQWAQCNFSHSWKEFNHAGVCQEVILKHTWQKHANKATECSIRTSCIVSSWTVYTISSQHRQQFWHEIFRRGWEEHSPAPALSHTNTSPERGHMEPTAGKSCTVST